MCKNPLTSQQQLIMLIALNKKQLGTLREIWSVVSGCVWIPFFSFPAFHQDWTCAWGMLRQPCLNYSLTLWPACYIDTTVQISKSARGCCRLQLCVRPLQDNARQWNLNCGAWECRGGHPIRLRRRLSITGWTSITITASLEYQDCKQAAIN